MARTNITEVYFNGQTTAASEINWQRDYGQILKFSDLDLPFAYEVDFSADDDNHTITQIGDADGVKIPDQFFVSANIVHAYVYLHSGLEDGETTNHAVLALHKRPARSHEEPTPEEQSEITQTIAALDAAVEEAQAAVEAIQGMGVDAEQLPAGSEPTVTKTVDPETGIVTLTFGLVDGEQGETGVGIQSISWNADYTMTVTLTNGSTYTSGSLRGPTGAPGEDGNGIASAVLNQDYTLTLNFTDGTSYTTTSIRGAQGEQGIQGVPGADGQSASITGASASVDANVGTPSVAVTAGGTALARSFDFAFHNLKGQPGQDGQDGISPTITVTEITGGHEVDVVDAEGTQTFDVMDGEVSEEQLETALIDKADVITSSASGEIVTIQDGGNNMPVVDLSVSLLPVQNLNGQDAPYPPGGGVNKANLAEAYSYGTTYGLTGTADSTTEIITVSGTYTSSATTASFRFLTVPNMTNGLGLKTFEITSGNHVTGVRWDGTLKRLIVDLANLVQNTAYNIQFKVVAYEGSTAPSAWSPYSNICPISGWTGVEVDQSGKNLIIPKLYNGIGYNVENGTEVTFTESETQPTFGQSISFDVGAWGGRTFRTPNLKTGTYRISMDDSAVSNPRVTYYRIGSDNKVIGHSNSTTGGSNVGLSITVNDGDYIALLVAASTAQTIVVKNLQCEQGSTTTAWEDFKQTTYPISWQSTAGTVYGGSLDMTTGVLKSVVRYRLASELTWSMDTINGNPFFDAVVAPLKTDRSLFMCEAFKPVQSQYLTTTPVNGTIYNAWARYSNINVYYPSITSLADWNTFIANNDFAICYPMTAEEYQLGENQISTLLGANNFWSNGNGQIDLKYRCDTKLYIENLTKPTEDDMTANANITSGSFFMVGNRLFLSTVAIAQGSTIIPGTNCTEISLADALNSLNS